MFTYTQLAVVTLLCFGLIIVQGQQTAAQYHQNALSMATSGDLRGALPFFERAVDLDPYHSIYHNDLGVTYMRLSQYRKAYKTFSAGMKIANDKTTLTENMAMLKKNLVLQGKNLLLRELFGEDPQDSVEEFSKQSNPTKTNYRSGKSKVVLGPQVDRKLVSQWFGDWFLSPTIKQTIRNAFATGDVVELPSFLQESKALGLHKEMYDLAPRFRLREGYYTNYQFHIHTLYESMDKDVFRQNYHMTQLFEIFNSPFVRNYVSSLLEDEVLDENTIASVAEYRAGDYTLLHNDHHDHTEGGFARRVAYVLHMAKDWNRENGGDLLYLNPLNVINPKFNNMVLFKVHPESWHLVTPVAMKSPAFQKRMAYNGWWTSPMNTKDAVLEDGIAASDSTYDDSDLFDDDDDFFDFDQF